MKTLPRYITEKLLINKNIKYPKISGAGPLNDTGRCICLAIPTKTNSDVHRIAITRIDITSKEKSFSYEKLTNDKIKIQIDCGDSLTKTEIAERTSGGFYMLYKDNPERTQWWCNFILFEKDALYFLNELLKDQNKKFDTHIFSASNDKVQVGEFKCYVNNKNELYEPSEIQALINDIEKSI